MTAGYRTHRSIMRTCMNRGANAVELKFVTKGHCEHWLRPRRCVAVRLCAGIVGVAAAQVSLNGISQNLKTRPCAGFFLSPANRLLAENAECVVVEPRRIELPTSALRTQRSPS